MGLEHRRWWLRITEAERPAPHLQGIGCQRGMWDDTVPLPCGAWVL